MSEDAVNKRLAKGDRIGKYEVLEFVASGGMATVYKARNVDLDRIVALKVLSNNLAKQPKMLDRFRREARAAARLQHENIVAIYEFGEQGRVQYLALEYVPGIDLQEYVEKRQKLPPEEARQIVVQATRALAHVHEQKVVHRDVKPSNFLLTRKDGRLVVKLTDLGLALHPSDEEFRLTRVGTTVGTVDYMAPEQARDSGSADIRSDIYSLGCTFYHILGGTAPFAQGTMAERLLQHLQDEPPDVRRLNKDVPLGYVAILQRMLAKKPEDRYQTPQELLRDLEDPEAAAQNAAKQAARAVPAAKKAPVSARDDGPPLPIPAAPTAARTPQRALEPEPVAEDEPAVPEDRPRPRRAPRTPKPTRSEPRDSRATRDMPVRDAPVRGAPVRDTRAVRDPAETRDPPAKRERSSRGAKSSASVPPWLIFGLGGAGLAGVILIGVMIAARGPGERKKVEVTPPPPTQGPVVVPADPGKPPDDKPHVAGNAAEMGVVSSALPKLYEPSLPLDRPALRREFYGPFEPALLMPASAPVLRVGRGITTGGDAYRSLAEALTAAPAGASIIEIHDRGPLFLDTLPALDGRDVLLRAAPGFRPLLAWNPPRSTAKQRGPQVLLTQRGGKLTVEGLDFVVKWTDTQAEGPAYLFQSVGGRLELRDRTVSLAGKQPHGIVLARLDRGAGLDADPTQLRISGCYARGTDLAALTAHSTSADVLIDHSLLVGNVQPLLRVTCREEDEVKLRIVRSTLVTAQNLVRVQDALGKGGSPRLHVLVWDALLARNDPSAPAGDLLRLAAGAEPSQVRWKAVNSVCAGWKQLLASEARSIDTLDLWHAQWGYREGDKAVLETWPHNPPTQLEDLPASVFGTHDTPVGFAAQSGSGALGAVIGRLPPEPAGWLARTFDRPPLTLVGVAPDPGVPEIDTTADGLYHGERLELPVQADLGVVLAKALHGKPLASRVVFKISGSGELPTTAVRVEGVQGLVLYFEPSKSRPPILTVDPKGVTPDRPALLEVQGGSLEVIGAHIRFQNSRSAVMPPYLLRVAGGSLRLHRCRLEGPLGKATDGFRALLDVAGPSAGPSECRLSECVLLSGKGVLHTSGAAVKLSARQNVIVALGDALQPDLSGLGDAPAVTWQLDGNTWALRRALIAPRLGLDNDERIPPILVQAVANYFTDPFGDPAPQSTLLRVPDSLLGRGILTWQGKGNGYDRRLHSYYAAGPQSLADWLALWGRTAEADALLVEPGPAAKTTLNPDAPQLNRLALPPTVRPEPGNPRPGVEPARLGLPKKKG